MKKVIPFRKEIQFKNYLAEITSISLEHTLKLEKESVLGEFIVSGDYKMSDTSTTTEKFSYNLPFEITLDEHYVLDKVTVDVDDFYYEIINNNALVVNIDVLLDHLEEKLLLEKEIVVEKEEIKEVTEEIVLEERKDIDMERCIEEEEIPTKNVEHPVIIKENVVPVEATTSLFEQFDMNDENYATYKICIVREGDSVMTITEKYGISEEELSKYNDLKDIKIGDKIIIPYARN